MSDFDSRLPIKGLGLYNISSNIDPNSTTLVGYTRNASIDDTMASLRISAAAPSADALDPANIQALDTNDFMHAWNGTGWDRLTATSGALDVNVTNTVDVNITNGSIAVTIADPVTVDVDGVYSGGNTDPDNVGLIAHVRATTPADTDQTIRLTGKNGTVDTTVWALDVSMHDQNGNAYTTSNPFPVYSVDSVGTPINNYQTSAAVAAGGTVNLDYTVTALKTLHLNGVWASASGKMKLEVKVETGVGTGTYVTKYVGFNSTATPNIEVDIKNAILVAAGVKVRLTITNRDNQPMDVYSTLEGFEV
jgi:hypothetical protein